MSGFGVSSSSLTLEPLKIDDDTDWVVTDDEIMPNALSHDDAVADLAGAVGVGGELERAAQLSDAEDRVGPSSSSQ